MRIIFLSVILLVTVLNNPAFAAGPWKGQVIDAETKKPIEGAVVLAVWNRNYRTPTGGSSYFYEAKEVLTDKEGKFEIPSYITINLLPLISYIEGPEFTIFKPGYKAIQSASFPAGIYAIGPSTIEYLHEKSENYYVKKTKTYSEGLIYTEKMCKELMDSLKETVPFNKIDYIYIPMDKALEKIKKLEVPLDCPKEGEPVPSVNYEFRNDVETNMKNMKNSFMIVELQKLKTREERKVNLYSLPPSIPDDKMLKLIQLMNKEEIDLGLQPSHVRGGSK